LLKEGGQVPQIVAHNVELLSEVLDLNLLQDSARVSTPINPTHD
jgi:hypothetical protein